jgi:peptidoglycan/xylan/chitin deacetylase (PgdA/CDA1 family)
MKKIGNLYFHGSRDKKEIALTFDDGPSDETKEVLKLLKKYDAKATFFIWGQRIEERENTIDKIIKEGHEIGNHSYEHKRLAFKSQEYIKNDIKKCDEELYHFNIKTNLFRPPGLSMFYNLFKVCKRLEKKIIACDVISNDWRKKGIEYSVKRVLRGTKNGSIINFHDYLEGIGTNEEIIPILEKVLPELKNKYKFVTVSELLEF